MNIIKINKKPAGSSRASVMKKDKGSEVTQEKFNSYIPEHNIFSIRVLNTSLAILCTVFLSACSVGMALKGQKEPDLSVIKKDVHRSDVELQLGMPIRTSTDANGQIKAIYEYEVGKEPSAGRAIAHGAMDVLTLGIWEVVGTPIEVLKGDTILLTVTYDKNGRLISANPS
ncbi:MAG: hypothetical protein H0X26_09505 [Alphaproteobacteria bacterium]|nr:hypothetical protein [Alphaproteobacteria bacterium]